MDVPPNVLQRCGKHVAQFRLWDGFCACVRILTIRHGAGHTDNVSSNASSQPAIHPQRMSIFKLALSAGLS